ncbi:hypothetical protein E2C01_046708 [Portunus trituberculatus]|uniref:Uncharacterized protein n=1 Tax=Portunus trituberculatus TaxID=210409 RepID=A0A5B7FYJ4_PORTR|nr:hypothetical protein [Portunus trituberculatus]
MGNIVATSSHERAYMNAWRDGNEVAIKLLGTPPLEVLCNQLILLFKNPSNHFPQNFKFSVQ